MRYTDSNTTQEKKMERLAYTVTPSGISIVLDNRMRVVPKGSLNFAKLREAILGYSKAMREGNITLIEGIVDAIRATVDIPSFIAKETFGRVEIGQAPNGGFQVRFDGTPISGVLSDRLIDLVTEGFDVEPMARFLDKLMNNPLESARNELYLFIESGNFVLTPDGDFLAFKKVRGDYRDIHSGTYDNSVGKVLTMDRDKVDPNRHETCSAGLHFCSYSYLPHFGSSSGNRVMIVKINPADVVAIPSDYKNAKGRTWRYVVVGEVPANESPETFFKNVAVTGEYDDNDPTIVENDEEDDVLLEDDTLVFVTLDGRRFTAEEILEAREAAGSQRGAARMLDIPRSTLWGWLQRIEAAA